MVQAALGLVRAVSAAAIAQRKEQEKRHVAELQEFLAANNAAVQQTVTQQQNKT